MVERVTRIARHWRVGPGLDKDRTRGYERWRTCVLWAFVRQKGNIHVGGTNVENGR